MTDKEPTDAMIDAAAESLAVIWPDRRSDTCTIGMSLEMRCQIKQAARDALLAAYKWRDTQIREKPFLTKEDESAFLMVNQGRT
jgi:hypothetical protein